MEKLRDPSHVRALGLDELIKMFDDADLHYVRTQFYKHEYGLEEILQRSFPNSGDADQIRQIFVEDLGADRLGVGAYRKEGNIYFAFPIVILVGQKLKDKRFSP